MMSSTLETETSAVNAANTYFTRLNTVDLFERTFHLLARKPITFLTISLVFVGMQAGFQWLNTYLFVESSNADDYSETAEYNESVYVSFTYTYASGNLDSFAEVFVEMARWIIYYVANSLVVGATVRVVAELYVGEADCHVTALLAIGTADHHLVQLVGACLLMTLMVSLPTMVVALMVVLLVLLLDEPWIFIMMDVLGLITMILVVNVLTYHTYPVIVVEKAGIVQSVQRSIQLTKGHRWEIFFILVLVVVFNMVLSLPYAIAQSADTTSSKYIASAVNFVVLVFTTSFSSM